MRVRPGAERWRELGVGAAAGTAAPIVQFGLRGVIGPPTPDEALTEWLVGRLPFPVFAWLLATLRHAAKPLGFSLTVVVTLIACGVGGVAFGWGVPGVSAFLARRRGRGRGGGCRWQRDRAASSVRRWPRNCRRWCRSPSECLSTACC